MSTTRFIFFIVGIALIGLSGIGLISALAARLTVESPSVQILGGTVLPTQEESISTPETIQGGSAIQTAIAVEGESAVQTAIAGEGGAAVQTAIAQVALPTATSTPPPPPTATPIPPTPTQVVLMQEIGGGVFVPVLGTHVVKPGEWLYCIGRAYGVKPAAIAQANGLSEFEYLHAKQKLVIPKSPWENIPAGKICSPQFTSPLYAPSPTPTLAPALASGLEAPSIHLVRFNTTGYQEHMDLLASILSAQPTPFPSAETRKVAVEWPKVMRKGASAEVRLTFNPDTGEAEVVATETTNQPPGTTAPTETRTIPQSISIPDLFDDYQVFAVARLDAGGFNVSPATDVGFPVRLGEGLTWRWSVKPIDAEQQTMIISLRLSFEPRGEDIPPLGDQPLWSDSFPVDVKGVFGLTFQQTETVSFMGIVVGLLSATYGVWEKFSPLVVGRKQEEDEEKKEGYDWVKYE